MNAHRQDYRGHPRIRLLRGAVFLKRVVGLLCLMALFVSQGAHSEPLAEALGHAIGSLGCVSVEDPDGRRTCGARALSSGRGCYSLSSSTLRQRCLDESLVPESSVQRKRRTRHTQWTPPRVDNPITSTMNVQRVSKTLDVDELQAIEGALGLGDHLRAHD